MLAATAVAAQARETSNRETCASLEACLAQIRDPQRRIMHIDETMDERILAFGPAAVDALVPMLTDPDPELRKRAGFLLAGFRRVDPRHLPALVHAWRHSDIVNRQGRGNGWLPRAIAATGTEEALRLLWADFLRDPDPGTNSQTFFALAKFGAERIRPLVLDRFDHCRRDQSGQACNGLISLLQELDPPVPDWSVAALVTLATGAASDDARSEAERALVRLVHPAGLAGYHRRLQAAARKAPGSDPDMAWHATTLIEGIASYGTAARASAPTVARFLAPTYDEDLRAAAALAIGRLGDPSVVPSLVGLGAALLDDWMLAYNAAESLGRLRAGEARPLLRMLADSHWHPAARNNARRALNAIAGRPFSRDQHARADDPPRRAETNEEGGELIHTGGLRFAGDDAPVCLRPRRARLVPRDPPRSLAWPESGGEALRFYSLSDVRARAVRKRLPVDQARSRIIGVVPLRDGLLVGFKGGESGGGVYHVPRRGSVRPLLKEPVEAIWRMGGRLYVATGIAHALVDYGHVHSIDTGLPAVLRRVRLPASPTSFAASAERGVIVHTREGSLGILETGILVDPATLAGCGRD
ncbi:MAG TPA: HEAT repeat domain-containing protein [Allosphingosinicella sp.]|nr:HEAT repeat domain-containing protein [Allosphingosinicella sp.]